jgi:hypothetical protein
MKCTTDRFTDDDNVDYIFKLDYWKLAPISVLPSYIKNALKVWLGQAVRDRPSSDVQYTHAKGGSLTCCSPDFEVSIIISNKE